MNIYFWRRLTRFLKSGCFKIVVFLSLLLGLGLLANWLFEVEIRPKRDFLGFGKFSRGAEAGFFERLTLEEQRAARAFLEFRRIKSEVIPAGTPGVYGRELGVSFDRVQAGINKLKSFGPTYGSPAARIKLDGVDRERYIKIGKQTACRYCCGVRTLVKSDGEAACGCAHSMAMRGLAAYLIKNHSREFTDGEILAEVNRWKAVFFPKQTLAARLERLRKSSVGGADNLWEALPDFLPPMVGGC